MKKKYLTFFILTLISIGTFNLLEAIGGRGGGGAGAGRVGAPRGSPGSEGFAQNRTGSFSRNVPSISMSRADVRTNPQQRLSTPLNQGNVRGQLQQYVQNPAQRVNQSALSQNLRSSLPQLSRTNLQSAAQAGSQFRQQHPNAGNLFNNNFFAQHQLNPNYYNPGANLWQSAGWASTAAWMGLASSDVGYPAYYYDSSGSYANLTPQEAITYSPAQGYTAPQQSVTATANIVGVQTQGNWLPLGVFAIGSSAEEAPYSNLMIQLSLSKAGYISGTFYNAATDQTYPIEGMVDKNSQEAIWKFSDNAESPVASTGIYNLTQDIADVQVHFPADDNTVESRVLVRLKM